MCHFDKKQIPFPHSENSRNPATCWAPLICKDRSEIVLRLFSEFGCPRKRSEKRAWMLQIVLRAIVKVQSTLTSIASCMSEEWEGMFRYATFEEVAFWLSICWNSNILKLKSPFMIHIKVPWLKPAKYCEMWYGCFLHAMLCWRSIIVAYQNKNLNMCKILLH